MLTRGRPLNRAVGLLEHVYLAGGCAVAHHLGHRVSTILDPFSVDAELDLQAVRRRAVD